MEQPFDDIDEVYKRNLGVVLEFFASKLPPYYSSSRLTLLLTVLDIPPHLLLPFWSKGTIPLPSRLQEMDHDALDLYNIIPPFPRQSWKIFRDFLNSGHPQALDGQRYATAALACLKIILKDYQVWLSHFPWLGQHYLTSSVHMKRHSQQYHTDLPAGTAKMDRRNSFPSGHLQFLLEKSAYSDDLLNFVHHRVFRFGYLHRKYPIFMKKAIFALAKYIQRVTGEKAKVKACESIWGRKRWFPAQ
jgi:hypothetical protein